MTIDRQDITRPLLDVLLFECAGYREDQNDKYPIRHLAVAFAHARELFLKHHQTNNLKYPGDVFIQLHKLHTHQGLRAYMRALPQGNHGYFPYPTRVQTNPLDTNGNVQEDHILLPACNSLEVNDFLQNYAVNVPSVFHDDIAAVVLYLRNNCWKNRKGSGGWSAELDGRILLGVTKYSKVHNVIKRRKAQEVERQKAAAQQQQQLAQEEETRRVAMKQEQERLRQEEVRKVEEAHALGVEATEKLRLQQLIDDGRYRSITRYLDELKRQAATEDTRQEVETLRKNIETSLRGTSYLENVEVRLFGSFESGLSTLTSDADFTVYNFVSSGGKLIHGLARILRAAGYGPIKTIDNARVPIASFVEHNIRCDISINQPMGVFNSQLINAYQKIDTRFLGIWFGLRTLADNHEILGAKTGCLSSYALTMMLIVFLQDVTTPPILPRLQQQGANKMFASLVDGLHCAYDRNPRNYTAMAAKNTKSEGQLLTEFCQYFGYTFYYMKQEVNPRLGVIRSRSVPAPPRSKTDSRPKDWSVCILDPFIPNRNVAGNCRNNHAVYIQQAFQSAYDALKVSEKQKQEEERQQREEEARILQVKLAEEQRQLELKQEEQDLWRSWEGQAELYEQQEGPWGKLAKKEARRLREALVEEERERWLLQRMQNETRRRQERPSYDFMERVHMDEVFSTLKQFMGEDQRQNQEWIITEYLREIDSQMATSDQNDVDFTAYNFARHYTNPIPEVAKALRSVGCQSVITIDRARVPIVSFQARGLDCDVSLDQPMAVLNSKLINTYTKIDGRFTQLWFAVRQIAKGHKIFSGSTGYLSSYALTMMLIVYLQDEVSPPILPRSQQQDWFRMEEREIDGNDCSFDHNWDHYRIFSSKNTTSIPMLLMGFCSFYGLRFNYAAEEVNPCLGAIRPRAFDPPARSKTDKRPKEWLMCVMDPFITGRNVTGNCRGKNVADIQKCFQDASNALDIGDPDTAFKRID
ncbi:hypothetical protein BGZ96_010884 [Linnemannia gamsii]|uniref:Poly(A) RNA polymerase mitochondrial-like central palm domain-containing protein n=1 Tax=Linnemannia gamsii TaxID=64522 RepID=A0ABQ7JU32_9FUNG|nr:hypothetical protein BGZ96_010884 [Linnemannia gamsii]